jgi:hypothetical protein
MLSRLTNWMEHQSTPRRGIPGPEYRGPIAPASNVVTVVHRDGHAIRTLSHVVELDGRKVRLSLSGNIDEHF